MTDVISDLLDMLRVQSTAYISKKLTAPWGVHVETHNSLARFHMVTDGSTWIGIPGTSEAHKLELGDIAIIPRGLAHDYFDDHTNTARETKSFPTATSSPRFELFDKERADTHLLCGYFELSDYAPQALVSRLPDLLIGRKTDATMAKKFAMIADLAIEESANPTAPSQATLNRLTEMLCVYTIQAWIEKSLPDDPQLQILADRKTKLVLDAIHDDPSRHWTVDALAKLHGQSNTAFAAHFKTAMGTSPMSYVRRWRIKLACRMLEDPSLSLDEIAFKSGYADTNAFNRAFKREIGTSPGAYRRAT